MVVSQKPENPQNHSFDKKTFVFEEINNVAWTELVLWLFRFGGHFVPQGRPELRFGGPGADAVLVPFQAPGPTWTLFWW